MPITTTALLINATAFAKLNKDFSLNTFIVSFRCFLFSWIVTLENWWKFNYLPLIFNPSFAQVFYFADLHNFPVFSSCFSVVTTCCNALHIISYIDFHKQSINFPQLFVTRMGWDLVTCSSRYFWVHFGAQSCTTINI